MGFPQHGAAGAPRPGGIAPSACAVEATIGGDASRAVLAARGPHDEPVVVVRALAPAAIGDVEAEGDLLDALGSAGAPAMPRLLGSSRGAYVRERGEPWRRGTGRRCDDAGAPATGERRALARARDDLDASLAVLHDRGWVLGLSAGQGLAIRGDGSVVVDDLSGLRRATGTRARLADQRWIDAVLPDRDRTLRRPRGEELWASPAMIPSAFPAPPGGGATSAAEPAGRTMALPGADADADVDDRRIAEPRPAVRATGEASRPRRGTRAGRGRRGRTWRSRRVAGLALLAAVAGASAAVTFVVGLDSFANAGSSGGPTTGEPSHASTPAQTPSTAASTAPPVAARKAAPADPRALVSELALARRAHIVEGAADTATVPGSPAAGADARLADAYEGRTVTGWTTDVTSAEVVATDPAAGTAVVRARISESERTVTEPSGEARAVPAVAEHDVLLALELHDGRWLIASVASA
ncbi:hypothetical protein [Brachybacterium huguangmaarense]